MIDLKKFVERTCLWKSGEKLLNEEVLKMSDKKTEQSVETQTEQQPLIEETSEQLDASELALVPVVEAVASPVLLPVVKTETEAALQLIQIIMTDPDADMDKFERLTKWHRENLDRQAEIEYNSAMALCQGEIEPVARNAHNTHTDSMYAKVDAIVEKISPIYSKHGFSLNFFSGEAPEELRAKGYQRLICHIRHSSGHKEEVTSDLPIDDKGSAGAINKTTIQGLTSTRTYNRKYMITEIFNVALKGADQDGNAIESVADPEKVEEATNLLNSCSNTEQLGKQFASLYNTNKDKDFRRSITGVRNERREELENASA